jgi:hypothetical protein
MKKSGMIAGALALGMLASPVLAGPPTPEQQAEFYKVCMRISENDTLCACKRDAAVGLIDEEFMTVVINSMRGATAPESVTIQYDNYIAQSNAICLPGY